MTAMALIATNTNTGVVVADKVTVASTHAARAVGLLGRTGLDAGEALWIVPSRGVHTWGMRFRHRRRRARRAWCRRRSRLAPEALADPASRDAGRRVSSSLPPGTLAASGTTLGHQFTFTQAGSRRPDRAVPPVRVGAPGAAWRINECSHRNSRSAASGNPALAAASADDDRRDRPARRLAVAAPAQDADGRRIERNDPGRQAASAVLGARIADPARPGRKAGRSSRRDRRRFGGISLHPHGSRARSGRAVPGHLPLRRTGAGAASQYSKYVRASMSARPYIDRDAAELRVRASDREQDDARPARTSGQFRQVAVHLRQAGQRQDRARGRDRQGARERDARAPCGRRRRPGHHHVRSGDAPADRR